MKTSRLFTLLNLLTITGLLLTACATSGATDDGASGDDAAADEEPAEDMGPVTLYRYSRSDIPDLDPQVASDVISIDNIESLFVHLTNYDLVTAEVVPEAATSWEVSADSLVFTFHLRTDIPWVYHNPVTGETTQVVDDEGNPRFVSAQDFVNAVRRACNPDLGSYYSSIIGPLIAGCEDVLFAEDPEGLTEDDYTAIGVVALDDATIEYTLAFPAAYFLSMTPMWTLAAIPQWTIDEFGDAWVEAGNIVTNGRYVLNEWVHGVRRQLRRNSLMPADMAGIGNIEVIVTDVVPNRTTGYALWLAGEVETSDIPDGEIQGHLDNYPDETIQIASMSVFYIAFAHDKEPFSDRRVRAAFSAAFDRDSFVTDVRQGQGIPMRHFAPPGITHAPPIDEVGVGYDPIYAAAQLADAGYPNCEGFPTVTLMGFPSEAALRWIEFAQANWSENLGCDPELIQIEQLPFVDMIALLSADTPTADRPHMWTLGWGPDYADENNWVGDVLWCGNPEDFQRRPCTEEDDWIVQAREEPDQDVRAQLYRDIEEGFFGEEGEFPFAPLFMQIAFSAIHSWYDFTPGLFGGAQFYNYSIDADMRALMTR